MTAAAPTAENPHGDRTRNYVTSPFIREQARRGHLVEAQMKKAALFRAYWMAAHSLDADLRAIDHSAIKTDKSTKDASEWVMLSDMEKRERAKAWVDATGESLPTQDHFACLIDVCVFGVKASQYGGQGSERKRQQHGMRMLRRALDQIVLPMWY